jgi:hypothetical protein
MLLIFTALTYIVFTLPSIFTPSLYSHPPPPPLFSLKITVLAVVNFCEEHQEVAATVELPADLMRSSNKDMNVFVSVVYLFPKLAFQSQGKFPFFSSWMAVPPLPRNEKVG